MKRKEFIRSCAFTGATAMSGSLLANDRQFAKGREKDDPNPALNEPKKIKVATVLSHTSPFNEAMENARTWIEQAAGQDASFICFPEYYFTKVQLKDGTETRGISNDSPVITELVFLARRYSIAIIIGVTEKERNRRFDVWDFYNTSLLIDEKGIRGRHRKVFLWVDADWIGLNSESDRKIPSNRGSAEYPYPPMADERFSYLPGWTFDQVALGILERVNCMICADGLMPPTWSHIINQSPEIIFYPNGRLNVLHRWGPDLAYLCKKYEVPVILSNQVPEEYPSEAAIFDSDGSCAAKIQGAAGIAVAEVTLGQKQHNKPVTIRHWDGDPMEMLNRLDKY